MSRQQVLAFVVALLLAAGTLAPRASHAAITPDATDAGVTAPGAAAEAAAPPANAAANAPAPDRPKGNGFVRALTAPFRALARLFGGGRKSADGVAQKPEEKPAEAQPPAVVADNAAALNAEAGPAPSAPFEQPPPVAAAPPAWQTGVNIVRPEEQARAAAEPRMWIPVIEGIGRDSLTQGRALLEHGYLDEAIAELSVAATGSQNLAEANNLLGLAYDRRGQHQQAVEAYERALTVASEDPVLLANLGYSLYLANDFGGAFKRLRQAARLAPQLNVVHNNLGIVQARLGKYDDAFRSFARATNEYDAHVKVAGILEFENRERQAIKHFEAALRLQPGASAVLERLVALYDRTGNRAKADLARRTLGQPKNDQRTTTGGGG